MSSSKIKNILIELHDYKYYHSPSQISDVDDRFIGRKRLKEKLKSILTNCETKSGSYLITGYRGMGKTSFVNSTINEISSGESESYITGRLLRLVLIVILLSMVSAYENTFINVALLLFTIIMGGILYWTSNERDNIPLKKGEKSHLNKKYKGFKILRILANIFNVNQNWHTNNKYSGLFKDIFIVHSFWAINILSLFDLFNTPSLESMTIWVIIVVVVVPWIVLLVKKINNAEYKNISRFVKPIIFFKTIFSIIIASLKRWINYSHREYVRINLSYDELKESDILCLLVKGIYNQFKDSKKIRFPVSFPTFIWRTIKLFIIVNLAILISYSNYTKDFNETIFSHSRISYYFPSQQAIYNNLLINENSSGNDKSFMKLLFNSADKTITSTYQLLIKKINILLNILVDQNKWEVSDTRINYLFIIYIFTLYFIFWLFTRKRFLGYPTPNYILHKISLLNDRIDSQVSVQNESGIKLYQNKLNILSSVFRRTKHYPIADAREIESELITILKEIDEIPRITNKPEFIFIFDELDKIEPHSNINLTEKEQQDITPTDHILFSTEGVRKRQQKILKILSNLKSLLTTSKAKFIFIAGREMYDASLADVSDRNYFIGSIFHEVLYVNSFFTDPSDGKLSDITSMTEQYVCRMILPWYYHKHGLTLKTYNKYLTEKYFNAPNLDESKRKEAIHKQNKIIYTLQYFITYLTYRSNGAPKKITRFFEEYVHKPSDNDFKDTYLFRIGTNTNNLYLHFDFHSQFTFGLISYLINPVYFSINKAIKDYGDKLLISISFLIDHLYKFHNLAFSWRNLELTPEIIDINKAPELRNLINEIVRFLSNTHLVEIISGLYSFRFRRRVSDEISFLSKVSEIESAAFNFTLDESLAIKRHYKQRLYELEQQYRYKYPANNNPKYIHTISATHMILGDLHFYDEEYNDAIFEYLEASQFLQMIEDYDFNNDLIVVLIRHLLKLGFALEKRKTYESAFINYLNITSFLIDKREIKKVGKFEYSSELKNKFLFRLKFTPQIQKLFSKVTLYEGVRLFYQSLLCKMQIIEKANLGGLSKKDTQIIDKEFEYLNSIVDDEKKGLIGAEYLIKKGNIIFFKNGLLKDEVKYCEKRIACCVVNRQAKSNSSPCSACSIYNSLLESTLDLGSGNKKNDKRFQIVYTKLMDKYVNLKRVNVTREVGTILSNLGNTYFSCCSAQEIGIRFDGKYPEFIQKCIKQDLHPEIEMVGITKIEEAILYIILSSRFFEAAGDYRECAFQITKILYIIRDYLKIKKPLEELKPIIKDITKTLFEFGVKNIYRAYENTHRLEIENYEHLFETVEKPQQKSHLTNLNNISLSVDVRELVILSMQIMISCGEEYEEDFANEYAVINSIFNRILELSLKGELNYNAISNETKDMLMGFHNDMRKENDLTSKFNELKTIFSEAIILDETKELILDSIFIFLEIIRSAKTLGHSYQNNHTIVATAHYRLGFWCKMYYALVEYLDRQEGKTKDGSFQKNLSDLIGETDLVSVAPSYHYEMALQHYNASLQTHNQGKAYKNFISNMYYLNDDFNDSLLLFKAALERHRINSGAIDKKIRKCKEEIKNTSIYKLENYTTPPPLNKI